MKKTMLSMVVLGILLTMTYQLKADGTPPDKPRPPSFPIPPPK